MNLFSRRIAKLLLSLLMCVGVLYTTSIGGSVVRAAAGDTPAHSKLLTDNNNGTYTLELTVTGDASTETTTTVNKSNVILVIDTSGSMVQNNAPGTNRTRLAETKTATNSLIDLLLANNKDVTTEDGVSLRDIIEISIVTFAGTQNNNTYGYLRTLVSPSVNPTYQTNGTQLHGVVNGLSAVGGTNWGAALARANSVANEYKQAQPNESVSIIFLTDGVPTMPGENGGTGGQENRNNTHYAWTDARDDARTLVTNGYTLYNIFAFGTDTTKYNYDGGRTDADYLRALTNYAYGTTNTSYDNTTLTAAARPYFFNASDSASLAKAFETIASSISSTAGIAEVGISDGTTNHVEKTSGEIAELLEVDESSYKYWMAWNVNNDGSFEMTVNNIKKNYTATQNGSNVVISWQDGETTKTATYPGTIKNGLLKIEWDKATDFYNVAPPKATFTDGSVDWDLNSAGVLLDNVTYSYSFTVYPSEYTLDLIADLENGTTKYSDLDENERKYLLAADEEGNPPYTLKTNTGATMKYTDTRTGETKTIEYDDPDPTPVSAQKMDLQKLWAGSYKLEDGSLEEQQPVTFMVLRDNDEEHAESITLTYNSDPELSYKGSMYIANGLMVVDPEAKTIDIKVKGHDYQLQEPKGLSYHWELDADILHPMIVNGKQEMLRLLEDSEIPEGMASTDNYYKDGDDVYYRIDGKVYHSSGSDAALTATNIRRSNLNLTKTVQGKDAPSDALFTFKLKVNSANGLDGKPEDLWFSVWTGEETFVDLEVEGATAELDDDGNRTGYFYVPSGTVFTVKMQPDWNLRFTNVLTGTTYEFEETNIPTGFEFVKVECNIDEEGTEKDPVISGQKISGTVVQGDTSYVTTFTNKFEFATATPEVTKELSVPEGITGPDDITGWYTFTLVEANGGKMQIAADEATVVELNKLAPTDGKVTYEGVEYTKISDSLYYYEATELTVTNPDADGGTAAFGKLLFNKVGTYEYTVTEAKSADKAADAAKITDDEAAETGKTVTVTVTAAEDGSLTAEVENVTFTNKYEPETIDVTVEKIWDDDNNRDKIQPASVSVVLTGDNEFSDTQTLNADNEWTYTWSDLLKYADYDAEIADEAIEYSLEEVETSVITGTDGTGTYAYEVTGNQTDGFKVTNTHTPEKTTVTVTKVWDDSDNQDGIRPATVQIKLMAEGEAVGEPVSLPIDGELTYTWTDLNKNKDGVAIEYTVEEVKTNVITGTDGVGTYAIAVSGTQADGYKVTNTHTPEVTERTVKKVWEDANNQDGIRPESVTMLLKNGDTTVATVTLPTEDGKWEATVEDLPKYAGSTTAINYTWVESPVPEGYEDTYAVNENTTTVTNTHTPEETTVTVTKVWDDADDQDGIRPETVQIKLLADKKDYTGENATISLPVDGKLTYTWEGLPKYAGTTTPVAYTVEEITTTVITGEDGVGTYKFEVTGTQADGYTVTNTHTPETTEIEVKKIWDDASNQDGKRPDSVTYQIYAGTEKVEGALATVTLSGKEDTWTAKVSGLPKYAGTTTPIEYSVKELNGTTELAEGGKLPGKEGAEYTVAYTGKLTVTNSYTPEETERTVVKKWDDNENQDGARPATLTVDLLADGTKVGSVTLSADNNWTDTIDELPVYKNGSKITYSWTEQLPADVDYSQVGDPVVEGTKTTITNKHTPDQTSVSVEKIWDDKNDQDGLQPESVKVQLMVGEENIGEAVELNADNNWKYTWSELDKRAGGEIIQYTVKEVEVPKGYEATVENKGAEGSFDYKVTNKHVPETTEATVKKEWDDDDDRDGIRPDDVTAVLLKDGKEFDTQVLNEENSWSYTWTHLDKYRDGGIEIKYTFQEKAEPAKYKATVEGNTIINTHEPETVTVPVEKVWDDADDQDGKRPDSIKVSLKADGKEIQTAELNEENGWKYTFESTEDAPLYKYKEGGKQIEYTVDEPETPEGYEKTVKDNVITNKHVPELRDITVKKVWDDNDNNDGKRTESITVTLKSGGTAIKQLTLNDENKWEETVKDLPKYKSGQEIAYTFEEMEVEGYTPEYSDIVDGVITITNTHEDELISVKVVKAWVGDEGYDVRPEKLEITLFADGEKYDTAVLSEDNKWAAEFTELPRYSDGEEIAYTVDEEKVHAGYVKEITPVEKNRSYKITNTFEPIKYDPPVVKTLVGDTELADENTEFTFKIEALNNGPLPEKTEVKVKAFDDDEFGWMYLTEPGEYKYRIYEDSDIEGYTCLTEDYELVFTIATAEDNSLTCELKVNGEVVDYEAQDAYTFEIINEYREYVEVEVEKIWVDGDNSAGKRPEELEVTLKANGKAIETYVLTAKEDWKHTFKDLPFSDEDYNEIKYEVVEEKVPEGYKMTSAKSDNKFTITNTIETPDTGDASNMALWLSLFGASMTGTLGAAYVSLKKKKEQE